MSAVVDKFLLSVLAGTGGNQSKKTQNVHFEVQNDLPVFVPLMTLDRFSAVSGIPRGILQGNVDRGYIPTRLIGRRRMVNVALLHYQLLSCEEPTI
jgi:hypothetical protein